MAQAVFDTLKFVKILTAKGVYSEQAEALSDAVRESHAASDVGTKRYLDDLLKDMDASFEKTDAQIASMSKEIDARFEKTDAQIVSEDSNFSKEVKKELQKIMAKAPNLVGSNEDIENLIKLKDDIIDLIATDILLKRAPEERTPLSEARKEAYDIYAKALNEIQTKNWEKITNRFRHKENIFTGEYTPAQQFVLSPADNTFGRGVGSTATTSANVTNCGMSRLSVTEKNGNSKVLCEGVLRHGILCASGLEPGSEEREKANIERGKEVLIAILLNNREKLERAFNKQVVKLQVPSISLVTPPLM